MSSYDVRFFFLASGCKVNDQKLQAFISSNKDELQKSFEKTKMSWPSTKISNSESKSQLITPENNLSTLNFYKFLTKAEVYVICGVAEVFRCNKKSPVLTIFCYR